jgi:hypothetical protein
MKKTISCLIALTILCQVNNLNAQTSTQAATTYLGDQKNGLPDGMGVLTDTAGNVFKGSFKKGKKEGYGELTYKTFYNKDSTLVGYWKKDQFVGLYEYPYKIISKSSSRKVNGTQFIDVIVVQERSFLDTSFLSTATVYYARGVGEIEKITKSAAGVQLYHRTIQQYDIP